MPVEFAYIIDELLHVQMDEDDNQELYHKKIIDTILDIDNMDEFIIALSDLIKRLAVDHLHIVGDIYDRGACADRIMNLLMTYHSVDIEWGNHDILWMGAAAGSEACIANVIRNNLRYHNTEILENSYGISLRELTLFAEKKYSDTDPMEAALSAISVIMFKLEGQIIKEHPEYEMEDRLLLDKIDKYKGTVLIGKERYKLNTTDFPTILLDDPYELSVEEKRIMDELKIAFINSACLQKHIAFLYEKGSMYRVFNGNLLYHGCIPMDEQGDFQKVVINGKSYQSKEYLDCADKMVRKAPIGNKNELDFMWYLWCGYHSPLSGRKIKTFERTYINNHTVWLEEINAYYNLYESENFCKMILEEFGLHSALSHIINGHTPVKTCLGEQPIRAGGKLLVIDGGFCRSYHKMTGIAGYTLIFNSHGIRIKAHKPFESVYKALGENKDIESVSQIVEIEENRVMVKDTDIGKRILEDISDLQMLLLSYRSGEIVEKG
jgi:fructose-1,6-bisphosphatase-3